MKKMNWLLLAAFSAIAAALRFVQCRTGFDENGLPIRGSLPGMALPVVLIAAFACFLLLSRPYPSRREEGIFEDFYRFSNGASACVVAGVFLVLGATLLALLNGITAVSLLLSLLGAAAAFSVLFLVFAFRSGRSIPAIVTLIPAAVSIVYACSLFLANNSNPILAGFYVGVLAASALEISTLLYAGFAYRSGAPRASLAVGQMTVVLSLAAAAELGRQSLLFLGCALIELGFLAAFEADATPVPT